ncbi:hypothetical protein CP980_26085 [Streptomyces vinaceus]|uniref:Uncharacterized protein n=1 Tax=Streptomyces vinaceus TaxID=1960 RepID=A0A5J6JJQ2_STRVI|nr:hypothetical protein [Streptomyces vinaceus]QEV50091.1 hypothetical protein CP980_26085 [Streptomyces vinaceus]
MNNSAPSGRPVAVPVSDAQRRIRRNPWLFTAPLVLLCLLVAILVWEVVRGNLSEATRAHWPWRLQLMPEEPLASLLAVAAGAVVARAQYARTVRPMLGWRSEYVAGELPGESKAWSTGVFNGGQHNVGVHRVDYFVVRDGDVLDGPVPEDAWLSLRETGERLAAVGLRPARDYRLVWLGTGFPLVATGTYETISVGVFSKRFIEEVRALHLRIQVVDSVGDTHERILDCLKGAREPVAAPVEQGPAAPAAVPVPRFP